MQSSESGTSPRHTSAGGWLSSDNWMRLFRRANGFAVSRRPLASETNPSSSFTSDTPTRGAVSSCQGATLYGVRHSIRQRPGLVVLRPCRPVGRRTAACPSWAPWASLRLAPADRWLSSRERVSRRNSRRGAGLRHRRSGFHSKHAALAGEGIENATIGGDANGHRHSSRCLETVTLSTRVEQFPTPAGRIISGVRERDKFSILTA